MSTGGSFIYPPPFGAVGDYASDLNFTLGSTVNIQWSGAPSTATLWLFRDIDGITCTEWNLASTYCTRILKSFTNLNTYSWTVQTYASSYSNELAPYYFVIGPEPPRVSGISAFDSHYFGIAPTSGAASSTAIPTSSTYAVVTAGSSASSATSRATTAASSSPTSSVAPSSSSASRASSSSSTGAGTGTSTSRASSSITSSPVSSAGASGSPSASSSPVPVVSDNGLSTGTKAAIGVAVGVGIPLIALLAYIAWILSRKRNKKNDAAAATAAAATTPNNATAAYQGYPELSGAAATKQNYSELSGSKPGAYPSYAPNPAMQELPGQHPYQPQPTHYELPGDGIRR